MAIALNALSTAATTGARLVLNPNVPAAPASAPPIAAAPAPAAPVAATAPAIAQAATSINPALLQATTVFRPPIIFPPTTVLPAPVPQNRTTTQLASGAITQLAGVVPAIVTQSINAIKSKSLDGPGLIPYLERKVRIGEVLNDLAQDWTAATRSDFASAFSMDPNTMNNDVADSIVSLAILNDKDLDAEILAENTPATTNADLTDNRRIVWQSVPPGTVLNPPYVIMVAVEYQDVATASTVLQSITNQLGTSGSGFRLPAAVIQKGVS